jgi:phytanoyl-CoA hydroxylase
LEARGFPYTSADEVPVEVKKGSVVFFNGYTLHRSLPNQAASGYRRALVNHYMSAESFLPWKFTEKTAMAMQDYRDIVMVAGEDPYAWKGCEDIGEASVRPTGQGGCLDWVTKQPLAYSG